MKTFLSILLLSLACYTNNGVNAQAENATACTTPGNETGLCVPLRKCTSLFNQILKGKQLTAAERHYLSSSQCDYRNNQPYVCCLDFNTTKVDDILPRTGECGLNPMNRIVRGITTDLDSFPWMALLEYSKPNSTKGIHCIGVLISSRYVLTAAHCVIGNEFPNTWNLTSVRFGEYDLLKDPDCENYAGVLDCIEPVVEVPILDKIVHERYDPMSRTRLNDIALLRLQSDVVYSDLVNPICLPRSLKARDLNYENTTLQVVGWNKATDEYSVKLAGFIDPIETGQCNKFYSAVGVSVHDTQLCGKPRPHQYDSCLGLPGSPIMGILVDENFVYFYLAGIEAFSPPVCGQNGLPSVFTKINSYVEWIESKLRP